MKKLSVLVSTLFIGGILVFVSCTKTGNQGPAGQNGANGAPGPLLYGALTGHIDLYDEYGGQQYGNASAAKVYLYAAGSTTILDSTNADSAGAYTISNISTGVYSMLFTAPGYGMLLRAPFQFLGGGNVNFDAKMSQMPDFFVSAVNADSINHALSEVVINCTVNVSSIKQRQILVFIGNSSSVSANPASYLSVFAVNVPVNTTTVVIRVPFSDIYNSILVSGSTPYFAIYGATDNYNTASVFEDLPSGKNVFTALSATFAPTNPPQPLP